jgi:hypothetical protein
MGRTRAAVEGLDLAFRQAIAQGDLPLAIAAMEDLRELGADVMLLRRSAAATRAAGGA